MDDTRYVLTQKRFLRGKQTLILDGETLKLEYKRGLSIQEYRFDLRGFLPDFTRIRHLPLTKIIGVTFLGLTGLFLMPFGIVAEIIGMDPAMGGLSALGALLLAITFVGWTPAYGELVNFVMFEGPGGRVILWPDLPTKEEFDEFLAVLVSRISQFHSREENVLRRLRQAGILDDWQYDQAVELLRQENERFEP